MELDRHNSTDVDWTKEPFFGFDTEVEALQTVQDLGEQLASIRQQERHVKRYLAAALRAAATVREDGEPIQFQTLVDHSGVARRTVSKMMAGKS